MIRSMRFLAVLALFSLVLATSSVYADEASQDIAIEKRMVLAQKFYQIKPVSELASRAVESLSLGKPPAEREIFIRQMRIFMDYAALEREMVAKMAETYTAEEIQAMIDYHGSDIGRSIAGKNITFQGKVSPILQQMLDQAFMKANYGDNGIQSRGR